MSQYYSPTGGLPPQSQLLTGRAVFKNAYAVIPKAVLSDITTSALPHWNKARFWVLARPMTGFAETFSHYIAELQPGGGSAKPDPNPQAQSVLFVVSGQIHVMINGGFQHMPAGGYAYIPAGAHWTVDNDTDEPAIFHWIRKRYHPIEGLPAPEPFITSDEEVPAVAMQGTNECWSTQRFADPSDLAHDMHVNIVTFKPGGLIPFEETHVMEHGLYVLQGKGVYRLNDDWVEVEAGDYMWLRAFCPQACYAGGDQLFRYLLYKDVNRHAALDL